MRYAFIGLGNLGSHLAASLCREGFDVTVHDLNRQAADRHIALGATWAASPAEAAANADAVITCLPSPKASAAVVTGERGVLHEAASAGGTWIEMSTTDQGEIARLAAIAAAKGIDVLEAPVTGGVHRAAAGEITVLVGGDKTVFEAHRPALEAMGGEIFHMGPLGSAAVIKVITNMLAFIHLVAAGEALMLAKRGGLDLAQAFAAIKASSGNSFVHETESQVILNGSYNIGFTMDLACKDLGFAMEFGREFGVPLELAGLTEQTFIRARAAIRRRGLVLHGGEAAGGRAQDRPPRARIPGSADVSNSQPPPLFVPLRTKWGEGEGPTLKRSGGSRCAGSRHPTSPACFARTLSPLKGRRGICLPLSAELIAPIALSPPLSSRHWGAAMGEIEQGVALHRQGDIAAAEAVYRRILDTEPDNPEALHLLGVIALQQGDAARAEQFIAKAVLRAPERGEFQRNLGLALMSLDRLDEAAASLRRAAVNWTRPMSQH